MKYTGDFDKDYENYKEGLKDRENGKKELPTGLIIIFLGFVISILSIIFENSNFKIGLFAGMLISMSGVIRVIFNNGDF